jgi:hypothetical protein
MISNRYAEANNKYVKEFDPNPYMQALSSISMLTPLSLATHNHTHTKVW